MVSEDFPPARAFAAGSRVAGYLLEEQIGQGGMAVVYRAHDERLDRTVALKILAPGLAQDQVFRQRFIRESRAAVAVDDPNIIPVFEAGEASGVLFIAMRFVRGGDARSLVDRFGPLPPGQAADIISQVASALDAAHEAGLVHRDVKPANILLDRRPGRPDHVFLSDFGLTKGALLVSGLTDTGQFLGTLDYTAPEQLEGKQIDGRADQYALACAAFELLSGEPPFRRADARAVMYAQLSEPPPRLTSRRPDLPAGVDAVFARGLAKAPAGRFRSCREFSEALRQALGIRRYDPGTSAWPQAGWPPTQDAASPAGTAGQGTTSSYAREPYLRPTETDHQARLRPSGPRLTRHVPARRSRKGALVLAGAGVAIVALAAVIVALTVAPNSPGTPIGPSSGPQVRHYGFLRSLARPSGSAVIEGAAFSPNDSTTVAVADKAGGVYLWNAATGNLITTIAGPGTYGEALAVAFSRDGSKLAAAFRNGDIVLWSVPSGNPIGMVLDPNTGPRGAQAIAFSPDGTMLASGDSNGRTYLWDLANLGTGQPAVTLPDPNWGSNGVQAVAFSPAGGTLASGDSNGTTYLWDLHSQTPSRLPDSGAGPGGIQALSFSKDGSVLVTADNAGRAIVWNTATRTPRVTFPDPNTSGFGAVAVAISSDGSELAVGDGNASTYLWNLRTRQSAGTLADPNGTGVQAVAFSPDGSLLATGDINGTTYVWQAG